MTTGAPGLRLGPYELIARIGAGGMGVKICHLQFPERFEREAQFILETAVGCNGAIRGTCFSLSAGASERLDLKNLRSPDR